MSEIFSGAWGKVKDWLGGLRKGKAHKIAEDEVGKLANHVQALIRSHIQEQDLPWQPLAESTIKKKGFDDIYLERGEYIVDIGVEVKKKKTRSIFRVGPSDRTARKGLTFQQLATYLEYGTSTIPARPIWAPTFREVKKDPRWANIIKKVTIDF